MTVINTNVGALQARTYAVRADSSVTKAMERLSSGLRINSAADDAAGLAVANKMESQIRGMNMAIRNSQDGISLVQTAEAAMGEINNMVIRMRELAVQMNNGVYTDADRANAQLEVNALLSEIDKVANNSAFNQVKILDGTYSQDIRAGNTNPEVINVTIDRMNTDSLGGGRVTRGVVEATLDAAGDVAGNTRAAGSNRAEKFTTSVSVQEGRPVIDIATKLGGGSLLAAGYTATLSTNTGDKFMIDGSNQITLNSDTTVAGFAPELNFDSATASNNEFNFTVTYTNGDKTTTEEVTLTVADRAVPTGTSASASSLTVEESACVKVFAGVDQNGDLNSVLSDNVKEFIEANNLAGNTVTYALAENSGGDDVAQGGFTINTSTGEILASLDYERPTGGANDNANTYVFDVQVTSGSTTLTETVTLQVTDYDGRVNNPTVDTDEAVWAGTSVQAGSVDVAYTNGARDGYSAGTESVIAEANTITIASGTNADNAVDLFASVAGVAAFVAVHTDANTDGFEIISIGDNAGTTGSNNLATGLSLGADGTLTVASSATAQTIEDVHIRLTADDGRTFDIFTDITIAAATGAAGDFDVASAVKAGDHSSITVAAGGEAALLDLKAGSAGDGTFDELAAFYDANPCGVFTVEGIEFNGSTSATEVANLTVDNSGNLTIAEGAAAGTYTATVYYEDNEGDTYAQRVDVIVSEVGIRGENGNGTAANQEAIAVANGVSPSSSLTVATQQVKGVSIININEGRQGTIKSVGADAVLSSALTQFANTDYSGGTFAISGADAELFTIDEVSGDITTKGLVDYEAKTAYNFAVTYTNGSNEYVETVTLQVADDSADNETHITDVDLGTQAGSASAVTILDTAINQISSSQAKLGAIQNRLQYNIDNLSKATMLTQTAKGRIMDADFAAETSELSKQQILSQAATSMLAQANQSKQSVLALLQ